MRRSKRNSHVVALPSVDSAGRYHADFRVRKTCKNAGMAFCMTDYASWRWHVTRFISRVKLQKTIALAAIILAFGAASYCLAQMAGDSLSYADMPQPTMPENEL